MGVFFGTDGLRGIVNKDLTYDLAYRCGNALASAKENPTIIIGRDTRVTGEFLTLAFSGGAISGGANIIDVGIIPTAGIAYLTEYLKVDYGVIISASHNGKEYNGIKIFDKNGYKLLEKDEEGLERLFIHQKINEYDKLGTYTQNFKLAEYYEKHLINSSKHKLNGLKVVIDASNGASYKIAPKVFKSLGAKVIKTSCSNAGLKINDNCGSLYPENLAKKVLLEGANVGFAFDGDADRIIAVDETGKLLDGDIILYILSVYFNDLKKLKNSAVVGTSHTNMGLEVALKEKGITLLRSDIGDKYVLEKMLENNLNLGGEQSGHIIIKDYATTGDGVLTAILIAELLASNNKKLSQYKTFNLYPQVNINISVSDKLRIKNSEKLSTFSLSVREKLSGGRVMVRASGTENKIRVMVECGDYNLAKKYAEEIANLVREIDKN